MRNNVKLEDLNHIDDSAEKKYMLMSLIQSNHRNDIVKNLVKSIN